jgi:hypothetical protein
LKKLKQQSELPTPKAIMVAIIDLGKLDNKAKIDPNNGGILATKPRNKE